MLKDVARNSAKKILQRRKVTGCFVVIVLIIIAFSINTSYQLYLVTKGYVMLHNHPMAVSHATQAIQLHLAGMRLNLQVLLLVENSSIRQQKISVIEAAETAIYKEYDNIFKRFLGERQVIDDSFALFINWRPLRDNIFNLLDQGKLQQAKVFHAGTGVEYLDKLQANLVALEHLAHYRIDRFQARSEQISDRVILITILLSIFSILAVSALIFNVWRSISMTEHHRVRRQRLIDQQICIATLSPEGHVEDVSSALCKLFGCWSDELISGKRRFFLGPGNKAKLLEKNILATISQGGQWSGEISFSNSRGQTVWIESSIRPSFDDESNIIGYTNILHDITNKKLANIDKLTGLLNRRSFDEVLTRQISLAVRNQHAMALTILDIDYFKYFNDSYGHPEGDIALRKISDLLTECMQRPSDFVYRLGGEEFAILTSAQDLAKTQLFLDSIRQKVMQLQIPHCKSTVSDWVTVSFGAAVLQGEGGSWQQLYKAADKALYQAKQQRNLVVVNSFNPEH
ncbi:MAG: diguanylate cyclase [Pseudomonadales bacterium]|nr:diguanylate cyclase [Pseudomonadales bacterium]NRA18473.1 diguanylate cyclase [Oceanospirillaceae bacterium]